MFEKVLENSSALTGRSKMKKSKGRLGGLTLPDFLTRRSSDSAVQVFTVHHSDGPRLDFWPASDSSSSPSSPITSDITNNNNNNNNGGPSISSNNNNMKPPTITISPSAYLNVPQFSSVPQIIEPEPYVPDTPPTLYTPPLAKKNTSLNTPPLAKKNTSLNTPPLTKKNAGPKNVPQINLKRRESGYEADLALINSHRSQRSISFSSASTVSSSSSSSSASRPYSPLLHLSASELFLADDDGRSSISSSMTSLSGFSSAESHVSSDSGVWLKDRRCVSFSDINGELGGLAEGKRYNWEKDTQSATVPSTSRLSSHSFCGARDNRHHHHHQRKHSGSYNEVGLHPHHACVDPLRSSRCRSVSCASLNTLASEPEFSGAAFAAKLYNRIGKKSDKSDALRNVSHVCHVYKGTLLLTDILEGKITFMGHNGRTMKEFISEAGSEPWCACVTPKGHVAVTLRRQSCVTVWSGHGSLVREFGHDRLACPTGLACDYKGRFIVTDERANRVAIFGETGKFLRYLGYRNSGAESTAQQGGCSPERPRRKTAVTQAPHTPCHRPPADNGRHKLDADTVFLTSEEESSQDTDGSDKHGESGRVLSVILEKCHGTNTADNDSKAMEANSNLDAPQRKRSVNSVAADDDNDDGCTPFQFSLPRYVCVTSSGKIVVSDSGSHSVKVFTSQGDYLHSIGQHGSGDGNLKVPYGVCCDQQENVYIADHYNDRVSVFSIDGEFIQHALTASSGLSRPKGVAIRGSAHERKLYVSHGGLRASEVVVYKLVSSRNHSVTFKYDV